MSKVDIKRLDSVTKNDTTATEQINDNFQALQQAIENTVSRDGTVPNYMDADLDLNSYRIINAGDPVNKRDVVTLEYFEEKAGGAIEAAAEAKASASKAASSAQSALVASNNAIGQVAKAESLLLSAVGQLADTTQYVDAAKADIDVTVDTAKADIVATVEAGKQEINTAIDDAQISLSDTINQAVDDVKTEAVNAANAVIEEAGATATQIATNSINDYTTNTVLPQLNMLVESAEADARSAETDAKSADEDAKAAEDWAKKAEASAKLAAENAQSGGKMLQLGFDGSMENGQLVFKHAPGGVEAPYQLVDDVEYELDLAFANTANLPTNTQMVIKNGNDTIRFVSALHRDATTNATVADMSAVMRFNSSTGYRWLFKAAYKVTPSGAKVFLLYPVVAGGVVTVTGDQTINGTKKLQALTMRAGSATEGGEIVLEKNTGGNISDVRVDVANNLFRVFATNSSGNTVVPLQVDFNNSCMLAMTPSSATDNSTKVATTAWVNTRLGGTGITSTELGYLDGVTSNIQTQLNAKAASITGGASTIATSNLTANRALISNGSGKVAVSSVTSTQLGYLSGVTSAIQTQLNGKLTASISKAGNGYVKFSNGLIIQWGETTTPNTVTFPTAFTATPRVALAQVDTEHDQRNVLINTVTKTSFKTFRYGSEVVSLQWIAIGY